MNDVEASPVASGLFEEAASPEKPVETVSFDDCMKALDGTHLFCFTLHYMLEMEASTRQFVSTVKHVLQ